MENKEINIDNPSAMLKVGTLLHGSYRIESYLASGGFGKTYLAKHLEFNEMVAVKEFFMKGVVHRGMDNTSISVSNPVNREQFEEQKQKFKKEALRLRMMDNRNIVKVRDLFEENGTVYYVMNYIDGESLSQRLKRTGNPVSEHDMVNYLLQVLNALEEVHSLNIWHLDLKPANIMIDKQEHALLIDFGASKLINPGQENHSAVCFTNGYAPPEQVIQSTKNFGPWTDFYALGATLYKCLTNQDPPTTTSIEDDGPRAFAFSSKISDKMRNLIMWMMKPRRADRPQSVNEIRDFLSHQIEEVEGVTIAAAAPSPTSLMGAAGGATMPAASGYNPDNANTVIKSSDDNKETKSNNWLKYLLGLAICLLVGGGIFYFLSGSDTKPAETTSITALTVEGTGTCDYVGNVDEQGLPHGIGTATFQDGRKYIGPWVHGVMEGENAQFELKEGVFMGTMKKNKFDNGTWTDKDGNYFKGQFKDELPDAGTWYKPDGTILQ